MFRNSVTIAVNIIFWLAIPFAQYSKQWLVNGEQHTSQEHCVSHFMMYTPSEMESKWLKNVATWQFFVCNHISNSEMDWWIQNVTTRLGGQDIQISVTRSSEAPPSYVFSTFTYKRKCTNSGFDYIHIPIEPTAGIARDPRKCLEPLTEKYTQSKDYLLPLSMDAAKIAAVPKLALDLTLPQQGVRSFLFDAGATVAGKNSDKRARGRAETNQWSGTEWIFEWYRKQGILFDQVHAWEPTKHKVDPSTLTPALAKALHFYNVGVTAKLDDENNPLARIKALCKPSDIVIFKLDIDRELIELELVKQLLKDDELLGLVDEFYFEHHVRNHVMRLHGLGGNGTKFDNLQSWYEMVTPARRKGLRMHFWP